MPRQKISIGPFSTQKCDQTCTFHSTIVQAALHGCVKGIEHHRSMNPECVLEPDQWGRYPLSAAIAGGHIEATGLLCELIPTPTLMWPLHFAARYDQKGLIPMLIRFYPAELSRPDTLIQTPLHLAAHFGHLSTVLALLHAGARVDIENRNGQTPLHVAIRRGHAEVAKWLIFFGSNVDQPAPKFGYQTPNVGLTPLEIGIRHQRFAITILFFQIFPQWFESPAGRKAKCWLTTREQKSNFDLLWIWEPLDLLKESDLFFSVRRQDRARWKFRDPVILAEVRTQMYFRTSLLDRCLLSLQP